MAVWNGLGITSGQPYGGYSYFLSDAQYTEVPKWAPVVASLFPRVRMIVDYSAGTTFPNNSTLSDRIWYKALKVQNPSIYILYGATNNVSSIIDHPELSYFIPSAYQTYRTFLLALAAQAQADGIDAFCVGNENLISTAHANVGMIPTSIIRSSNVATATFSYAHGLTTDDYIFVSGGTDASFRVADSESGETIRCTVTSPTTITYDSIGSDGASAGSYKVNWSAYEVVRKTKALAVDCQAVFTRGPIVYSESQGHETPWINLGISAADIDLFGINGYGSGTGDSARKVYWKSMIDALWTAFEDKLIVTEHNVVQDSGNEQVSHFNKNNIGFEEFADREILERLKYLQELGVTQVYLFGAAEYPYFASTYPSTDYNNAYIVADYKAVINRVRGERVKKVLFGVNTLT